VVEGDAPALANGLSAALGVPVTTFEVFQTATLNVNDHHIDLAMARREHYPRPGALPVVEAASVRDDIERRDFTINTLLVDLRPERFGELVDWKDGLADLRSGLVRVLHPLSFAEDPTRLFRAVRLACRFGFELDDRTAALFRTAVSRGHVETVKPRRIWKELERMLVEPAAAAMVERLFQTGLARALLDRWTAPDTLPRHLRAAGEMRERPQLWPALKDADWAVAWLALATAHLADVDFGALAARLGLPDGMAAKTRDASQRALELSRQLPRLAHAPASEAAAAVRTAPPEAAIVAIVTSEFPETPQLFHRYFRDWMHVKPHVTGDDLQRLGLEPGPLYRETLDRVRDAQLDGLVQTKNDALALVRKIWKEKTKETKPR
jgi:tRNA nucleotidyltransferase (CCA-adding enzyme)